jgi:hypothetical protein
MAETESSNNDSARVTPRGVDPETLGIVDHETLDPQKHYRFVQDRPQRVARMRAKGYRLVSVSEDGVRTVLEDDEPADDRIRDGDTVLMCVPKEKFIEGRKKVAKVTRGRMAVPEAQFRKKTRGSGPGGVDIQVTTTKE